MRLLTATLFLAAALPLHAAQPVQEQTVTWYDVEIIVFRQLDARSGETWPPDAGVPDTEHARALFPAGGEDGNVVTTTGLDSITPIRPDAPVPYVPLEQAARQLNGVYGSLQRSSRYEPLLHVAWTQPPLDREQAPHLRLALPGTLEAPSPDDADVEYRDEQRPLIGRVTDEDRRDPTPTPDFLQEQDKPQHARPLDGRVQLSVSRYLHLDLDLLYLPDNVNPELLGNVPVATQRSAEDERRQRDQRRRDILDALARGDLSIEEAEILSLKPEQRMFEGFRLNQFRRMRSREIHYFDHPVYGAIVTVTPRQVSARMLDTSQPDTTR